MRNKRKLEFRNLWMHKLMRKSIFSEKAWVIEDFSYYSLLYFDPYFDTSLVGSISELSPLLALHSVLNIRGGEQSERTQTERNYIILISIFVNNFTQNISTCPIASTWPLYIVISLLFTDRMLLSKCLNVCWNIFTQVNHHNFSFQLLPHCSICFSHTRFMVFVRHYLSECVFVGLIMTIIAWSVSIQQTLRCDWLLFYI